MNNSVNIADTCVSRRSRTTRLFSLILVALLSLPLAIFGQQSIDSASATEGDTGDSSEEAKELPSDQNPSSAEPGPAVSDQVSDENTPTDEASSFSFAPTGVLVEPPAPWTEQVNLRLGGLTRYDTAAAVTQSAYPGTVETVIVASAEDFPDALSAGPLSAKLKAPLLPVASASIPPAIRAELTRLQPRRIIIIGGPGVVLPQVEASLREFSTDITRVFGNDRYSTSAAISALGWSAGSSKDVFVATGTGFADALAAAAAAAKKSAPVLLIPGNASSVPKVSSDELSRLGAKVLHIAGGYGSVSSDAQASILNSERTAIRYAGSDRYDTAAQIVSGVFTEGSADTYLANAEGFADALAGAAAAGARGGALLLVQTDCIPSSSYAANDRVLPGATYLLGGEGSLSKSVLNGNECSTPRSGATDSEWRAARTLYTQVNQARFDKGLGALRLSDDLVGAPAQLWASQVAKGAARTQPDLTTAQPWVRYQVSAVTPVNRAERAFELIQSSDGTSKWMYQPNAGVRGFVSVGYATSNSQSAAVMFFGAGLDD